MGLQAEFGKLGMARIVIVLLCFHARVRQVIDLYSQPEFLAGSLNQASELQHGKLLGKLIKDAIFMSSRRIQAGQLNTTDGIADVEETAGLTTFAVNRDGMTNGCLHTETVQRRAKHFIVIKTIHQGSLSCDFIGYGSVNHSLIEIGGTHTPNLAAESDIVAVVDFGKMI